ncbi:MAG: hypothetical protein ACJARG_001518 [Arcticibacterium sp.]|jgi:hypothetical protein
MNKNILLLVLFMPLLLLAQDPHMRKAKSLEELLKKSNPDEFRALENHEKYLVIEKIGSTKRKKIFISQPISFQTTDDNAFIGNLTRLTDSTFTLTYLDKTSQRYELRLFYLKNVTRMHKRILPKGLNYSFSPTIFIPVLIDWAVFNNKPWKNVNTLYYLAGIEAGRVLLLNRKKLFNTYKFNSRRRLRVFQY